MSSRFVMYGVELPFTVQRNVEDVLPSPANTH
jgi:hypothetical protein